MRTALWMALWIACGIDAEPLVVEAASPLLSIDRDVDRTPWTGHVEQRIEAGGYTYWQIDGRWVVGLSKPVDVADQVEVRPVGVARDFESARTGRTFGLLWFAVVRSTEG